MAMSFGFRVYGLGSNHNVYKLGFRVLSFGFRVYGLGSNNVCKLGFRIWIQGCLGFRV
jgi:hypothetical protein